MVTCKICKARHNHFACPYCGAVNVQGKYYNLHGVPMGYGGQFWADRAERKLKTLAKPTRVEQLKNEKRVIDFGVVFTDTSNGY